MQNILVSIIIPVYKVEQYIERCLDSVLSQTYRNIEVILVDDCSPDHSMEVAHQYIDKSLQSKNISFLYLKHDHNRGLSAARNSGLNVAKGKYVYFLDSDDELTIDCIEKLSKPLKDEYYDLVVGNIQTIGNDRLHEFLKLKLSDGEVLRNNEIINAYRRKWNMMAQNKLYKLDFIRREKLKFKEGLIHEDELWSLQVACLAKSLRSVGSYTYKYYIRQGSIMSKSTIKEKGETLETIALESYNFIKERKINSSSAFFIIEYFTFNVLENYLTSFQVFFRKYLFLKKNVSFSFIYRVRVCGFRLKRQLLNICYLLSPRLEAFILYKSMKA